MTPQLCLGTVQFGLPYGITNICGQVSKDEVKNICLRAASHGIQFIDTAQSYGVAESVLGECWPCNYPKKLISKLSANTSPDLWETSFHNSLKQLRTSSLDTFLLHRPLDLKGIYGNDLIDWLTSLQKRKLVSRIGLSIYTALDLVDIPLEYFQVVQLPVSLYDQRLLLDGTIDDLKSMGISVHVRSIFMQGLLLKNANQWPNFLSPAFRKLHERLGDNLQFHKLSYLECALAFAKYLSGTEAVLFGVLNDNELLQIIRAWDHNPTAGVIDFSDWAWNTEYDLDPRNWNKS